MTYPWEELRGRFRSMAIMEVVNAVVTLPVVFLLWRWPPSGPNLAGAACVAALLFIGSAYWWAKVRQLDERTRLPSGLRVFAVLRPLAWLLALGALGYGVAAGLNGGSEWGADRLVEWLPGAGLALFGILEVVNYFHVQLSHDNRHDLKRLRRKGLRRAPLARDLDVWRSRR